MARLCAGVVRALEWVPEIVAAKQAAVQTEFRAIQ